MNAIEIPRFSGQGVAGLPSMASSGQIASVENPTAVATMCRSVVPPPTGSGESATVIAQAPPSTNAIRPAGRTTHRSPYAVTR